MFRPNLRALTPTLAFTCLLAVSACDQAGPSATELDSDTFDALQPELSMNGWRGMAPSDVYAYPDGTEPLGQSWLQRGEDLVRFRITTGDLMPGHAYTLWMIIFNNPAGCVTNDEPGQEQLCNDFDLFNPDAQPDMVHADGKIVGASGEATFVGHRRVGTQAGSANAPLGLPSNGLTDPEGADIRFIVHDHGPMSPKHMPDMIQSIDGGCIDAGVPYEGFPSPWNLYDGPRALPAFGRRGDNTCQSVQFTVHLPGS